MGVILCQLDEGESWDGLLEGYPELTRADINAALREIIMRLAACGLGERRSIAGRPSK